MAKVADEEAQAAADKVELGGTGMVAERKCRDILFLLLFIGFLVGMVVIGVMAFQKGDYAELMYGSDSYGNVCGKKNNWAGTGGPDLTDKKKLYFLDPTEITNPIGLLYAKKVRSRFPIPPTPPPPPDGRRDGRPPAPRAARISFWHGGGGISFPPDHGSAVPEVFSGPPLSDPYSDHGVIVRR